MAKITALTVKRSIAQVGIDLLEADRWADAATLNTIVNTLTARPELLKRIAKELNRRIQK